MKKETTKILLLVALSAAGFVIGTLVPSIGAATGAWCGFFIALVIIALTT